MIAAWTRRQGAALHVHACWAMIGHSGHWYPRTVGVYADALVVLN